VARAFNPSPSGASSLANVRALVDLCAAQTETIRSLGAALSRRRDEDVDRRAKRTKLAHQLDTPMASLVSTLHALAWPNFDSDVRAEMLGQVTRQAEQLHRLVQDLLCNHEYEYEPVPRAAQELVPLRQIVEDSVLASSTLLLPDRVSNKVAPRLVLRTHPGRVHQIVVNLLVNVAKHCPAGTPVTVRAAMRGQTVHIEVVDRGPGIDDSLTEDLFEPFRQGPGGAEAGGLGIGLYVVRALAHSLGGEAALLANPEGGTLARVRLPQKRASDPVPLQSEIARRAS
jgi:two-component system OmpR family sensor kinase